MKVPVGAAAAFCTTRRLPGTYWVPAGMGSTTTTFVAPSSPVLLKLTAYSKWSPTRRSPPLRSEAVLVKVVMRSGR